MALVVVLAGGGTGGHIYPALALADVIVKRDPQAEVRFVGTQRGIETRVVEPAGYALDLVPAAPVLGRGLWGKARAAAVLVRGVWVAARLLRRIDAGLVIGVGGYVSVPTVVAGFLLGIPTALLNVDVRPGLANRALGRIARRIFIQFDESRAFFPQGRCERTGMPVRSIPHARAASEPGVVRVLIFGGSQGAHAINDAIAASLDQLGERDGFRLTHQTGTGELESVRAAYAEAGVTAEVAPFFDDMPERYANADLVVGRAGASTLAEICMAGLPSILVPYPHHADQHQLHNALALEAAGAAVVVRDEEARARLAQEIRHLASDAELRRRMADAAAQRAIPDAADRIWSACAAWLPVANGGSD